MLAEVPWPIMLLCMVCPICPSLGWNKAPYCREQGTLVTTTAGSWVAQRCLLYNCVLNYFRFETSSPLMVVTKFAQKLCQTLQQRSISWFDTSLSPYTIFSLGKARNKSLIALYRAYLRSTHPPVALSSQNQTLDSWSSIQQSQCSSQRLFSPKFGQDDVGFNL